MLTISLISVVVGSKIFSNFFFCSQFIPIPAAIGASPRADATRSLPVLAVVTAPAFKSPAPETIHEMLVTNTHCQT